MPAGKALWVDRGKESTPGAPLQPSGSLLTHFQVEVAPKEQFWCSLGKIPSAAVYLHVCALGLIAGGSG